LHKLHASATDTVAAFAVREYSFALWTCMIPQFSTAERTP
jgi:hypothetical protein